MGDVVEFAQRRGTRFALLCVMSKTKLLASMFLVLGIGSASAQPTTTPNDVTRDYRDTNRTVVHERDNDNAGLIGLVGLLGGLGLLGLRRRQVEEPVVRRTTIPAGAHS
jgi:LPXTG-motif cell wall-anchored protein